MKKLIMLFIVTLVLVSTLAITAFADQDENEIFVFNNQMGAVAFNHTAHKAVNSCMQCHPESDMVYNNTISIAKIGHGSCKSCHQETSGPTTCNGCHE